MLERRYTDEQLNDCFKKTKENLEKEKRFMMRLAEAGENILLMKLFEKKTEKREFVEKVNAEFPLSWRKRKVKKQKKKIKEKIRENKIFQIGKNILVTTLLSVCLASFVYIVLLFVLEDEFAFFAFFLCLGSVAWLQSIATSE